MKKMTAVGSRMAFFQPHKSNRGKAEGYAQQKCAPGGPAFFHYRWQLVKAQDNKGSQGSFTARFLVFQKIRLHPRG